MDEKTKAENIGWEYAKLGDYHRNLDLNWSYAPTYLTKMNLVHKFLNREKKETRILDAGCGEGVLVEEFRKKDYAIIGIDKNYESEYVQTGDISKLPYSDNSFDVVLLLDVFEHFEYKDQDRLLQEIHRVLSDNGKLVLTIPNLTHLNTRFETLFFGKLDRSDAIIDHPGERSYRENYDLITANGFEVLNTKGMTLSIPILIKFIRRFPRQLKWLHDILNYIAIPSLSQFNYFECRKL